MTLFHETWQETRTGTDNQNTAQLTAKNNAETGERNAGRGGGGGELTDSDHFQEIEKKR